MTLTNAVVIVLMLSVCGGVPPTRPGGDGRVRGAAGCGGEVSSSNAEQRAGGKLGGGRSGEEAGNSPELAGVGEQREVGYKETKVPPPTNLQLFFINISAVSISWDYPTGDDPLPIQFLVRICHDGGRYTDASELLSDRRFVYNGMLLSGYYQFQVLAYFEGISSKPASTDYFVNGITAPPGPPQHVRAYLLTPREVTVEWDGPSTSTPLLYIVYWGNTSKTLNKVKEVYQSTHVSFPDLPPDSTLFVRLRADISGRLSILSEMVNVTTPPLGHSM